MAGNLGPSDDAGSGSSWLSLMRAGDEEAAQELWEEYFPRLVSVARARLGGVAEASGQDAALSALESVMGGLRKGRFPRVTDRESLWPLLVTITTWKAIDIRRRQKPDQVPLASADEFPLLPGEPTPEFAALLADEMERLIRLTGDPQLRQIAQRKLEGCTHEEIATELGCTKRTIIRKIKVVREKWTRDDGAGTSV